MTDQPTTSLWPWVIAFLILLAVLLLLANHYMSRRLPQAREGLDGPVLVGSELDTLSEDAEADHMWEWPEWPVYERRA